MIDQKRPWLVSVSWESVVSLNRTLCQAQKLEALVNAKNIAVVRDRWERAAPKLVSLFEALAICRDAFERSPFTFNNGNTFAALARNLVEDSLRNAPAVEAQIIRTTISHYVAGTIGKKELHQVLTQLAPLFERAPAPPRTAPDLPAPPTPQLTEARPA